MSDRQETYIYESPDGGDTVYRRAFGSDPRNRELHYISPELRAKQELDAMWMQWIPILRDSRQDPALKDMLDKIIVYHKLKDSP